MATITLTDEQVDKCAGGSCRQCAVAAAISTVLREGFYPQVTADSVNIHRAGHDESECELDFPLEVGDWIMEWDRWKRFTDDCDGDVNKWLELEGDTMADYDHDPSPDRPNPITFDLPIPRKFRKSRR